MAIIFYQLFIHKIRACTRVDGLIIGVFGLFLPQLKILNIRSCHPSVVTNAVAVPSFEVFTSASHWPRLLVTSFEERETTFLMSQEQHSIAMSIKRLVASVVGLLAWTLSIQVVPVTLEAQPTGLTPCNSEHTTTEVFESLMTGVVTNINNDGIVLSVEIGTAWNSLRHDSRRQLYHSLRCLAQQEHVSLHVLPPQFPSPKHTS